MIYCQNKSEDEIFKKMINNEIVKDISGIYIECKKPITPFNIIEFKEETAGFEVPEIILKEIENSKTNNNEIWNSELIDELQYKSGLIKSKNCLSKEDIELIFKKTRKRQNIVLISKPIFDNNYENCVVSIIHSRFTGSAYGNSYFLKKVYGIWTIIIEYGYWMT